MNQLVDLQLFEVSVVDKGANGLADIVLYKRNDEDESMARTKKEVAEKLCDVVDKAAPPPGDTMTSDEEITEDTPSTEVEVEVEEGCGSKKTTKSESSDIATSETDVEKAAQEIAMQLIDLQKRNAEALEEISKLRSEKKEAEWISKSQDIAFDTPDNVGKMLHSIDKYDSTLAENVYSFIKAASAQIKEGKLFTEIGKSGDTKISAYDKLSKIADEIRKSQNVSEAKAFTKACELNPTLVSEYRQGL